MPEYNRARKTKFPKSNCCMRSRCNFNSACSFDFSYCFDKSNKLEFNGANMMIEIRRIDAQHISDINIPNEAFPVFGRIIPSFNNGHWTYKLERYHPENITEITFPNKDYVYEDMEDSVFLGAYDGEKCVGLVILQPGFFKYMYLYDLKVNKKYRGQHVGQALIAKAKEIATQYGYYGLYTQGQDNNPGACLFYLNSGFYIGGLDTNVYRHTKQEGKADILFYCEAD